MCKRNPSKEISEEKKIGYWLKRVNLTKWLLPLRDIVCSTVFD